MESQRGGTGAETDRTPQPSTQMFRTFLSNGEYAPPLVYPEDL